MLVHALINDTVFRGEVRSNAGHYQPPEGGGDMNTRFVAMMFACLVIGAAGIVPIAGCTQTAAPAQAQACPAGVPWVPDGYANGKWVPAHCQGYPAQ
jgi:hypothetical protein